MKQRYKIAACVYLVALSGCIPGLAPEPRHPSGREYILNKKKQEREQMEARNIERNQERGEVEKIIEEESPVPVQEN